MNQVTCSNPLPLAPRAMLCNPNPDPGRQATKIDATLAIPEAIRPLLFLARIWKGPGPVEANCYEYPIRLIARVGMEVAVAVRLEDKSIREALAETAQSGERLIRIPVAHCRLAHGLKVDATSEQLSARDQLIVRLSRIDDDEEY